MTNRQLVQLGDLVDVKHGFAFKGEFFRDSPPGDILLTPGNFAIGGGFKDGKFKYYDGPVPPEFILEPGDLLVTMTDLSKAADTLGFPAVVPHDGVRYLHNQRLGKVVPISDDADLDYIYWVLRSREYRAEILSSYTGSTVKHTSPTKIKAFKFEWPEERERSLVCEILGSLDDKIEANRRMNETLEAMAQAIFSDWFVDFGPTRRKQEGAADPVQIMGGVTQNAEDAARLAALFPDAVGDDGLPQGWEERTVEDVLTLSYGKALKASNRTHGPVPVYGSGGITGYHNFALVDGPSVIVGRKGTVGSLYWEDEPFFPIDTVFYVEPKASLYYCYYLLQTLGLSGMNTDAAVPGLNRNNAYRLAANWPGDDLVAEFDKFAGLFRSKIAQGNVESKTLAETRDLLLPRLMSGVITLKDAEVAA